MVHSHLQYALSRLPVSCRSCCSNGLLTPFGRRRAFVAVGIDMTDLWGSEEQHSTGWSVGGLDGVVEA